MRAAGTNTNTNKKSTITPKYTSKYKAAPDNSGPDSEPEPEPAYNMLRIHFRIRTLILYILIFLLGFVCCLLYLQISFETSGSSSQVVIDDYYKGGGAGDLLDGQNSGQVEAGLEPCASASVNARNGIGVNSYMNNIYYEEVTNDLVSISGRSSTIMDRTAAQVTGYSASSSSSASRTPGTKSKDTVWVVTPTFYRPEQKPELTRLAQALLPAAHFIHWIVVDDISQGSEASLADLHQFLQRFPLTTTLLKSIPRSEHMKIIGKPRGVNGRRAAIAWLRKNAQNGVVYFADDDNTYDSDIFKQMQLTKKVSMWPVGLVTELGVSSPIVKHGKVIGFYDGWNGLRKFPVDMAGFSVNMNLFHKNPQASMPFIAGYEEDELLRSLEIKIHDISPLAKNCTEVLVWHTKAIRNNWPKRPRSLKTQTLVTTNLNKLLKNLPQKNLAGPSSSTKAVNPETEKFSFFKLLFGGS